MEEERKETTIRFNLNVWQDLEAYCKHYGVSKNAAIESFTRQATAGFAMMQKLIQEKESDS